MSPHPKYRVSAIVPVFQARFLSEALMSIAAQHRPADEVIVVDDGSPERASIRRVTAAHPFVTCIEQENRGAAAARNAGILAATGDLIAFLDADDAWLPELLSEQIRLLSRSGADLVYSDAYLEDASGRPKGRFTDTAPSCGDVTLESLLAQRCTVLTSSVVMRRDTLMKVGLFDPQIRRGQDFDLWLRLAHAGAPIQYHSDPLLRRRVHPSGLSGTPAQELERALSILEKASALDLSDRERLALLGRQQHLCAALERERGKEWLASGEYGFARDCLSRAHAAVPGWKLRATLIGLGVAPRLVRSILLARAPKPAPTLDPAPAELEAVPS